MNMKKILSLVLSVILCLSVFVGCGGADDAMEVFQRRLGGIKRSVISYDPKPPVIPEREPRFISERMDVTQGKLVMALRGQTGLDMRGKLAARVMSALLGGTAFSLLFKNVRERMSLCYYCLSRYDRGTGTLLLDSGGRRLSKRDGSLGLEALRSRYTPEEIIGRLAFLAGLNPAAAPCRPEDLLAEFDWRRVPLSDVRLPENLF